MTVEIEEGTGELPPPKQTGRRKRSANVVEPDPVVPPAADGGNGAVDQTLQSIGDLQVEAPQAVEVRRDDFETDNTFAGDVQAPTAAGPEVGQADPNVMNPFTRGALEAPESRREVREQRREDRQASNQQTPSTKRFGALGKKLPGSEHVQVYKRTPEGKLAYVGDFNTTDLTQSQNIQSFLYHYVRPKHGFGEYNVRGVDAQGREFDAGTIELHAPLGEAPAPVAAPQVTDPLQLVQKLMDQEAERRRLEMQMLLQNQRDPFEQMAKMHGLMQQMTPPVPTPVITGKPSGDGGQQQNAMAAMVTGMMQMMGTLMTTMMQPKQDPMTPVIVALISKLADNKPAAVDPTQQLVALSEVAKNLRGDSGGGSNQMVDLLLKERMSPTDVLNLVNQLRSERGTDDLKKSLENVGMLFNAVQQVRAHTEPSASGGFLDVIASALNNPALAEAVLSKTRGGGQARSLPPQPAPAARALPANDPLAQKARELAARKLRLEELDIARREQALLAQQQGAAPQPIPVESTVAEPAAPAAPSAPEPNVPEGPAGASLPPNIANHINAYLEAKDDSDIIKITFDMLLDMSLDPRWAQYSKIILALVEQSDRGRFLHYMASLFSSLKTIQLISDELARRIMDSLQRNFEALVQFTRESIEGLRAQMEAAGEEGDEGGDDDEEEEDEEEEDEDLLKLES